MAVHLHSLKKKNKDIDDYAGLTGSGQHSDLLERAEKVKVHVCLSIPVLIVTVKRVECQARLCI